jgi:hypothetical protein
MRIHCLDGSKVALARCLKAGQGDFTPVPLLELLLTPEQVLHLDVSIQAEFSEV